MAKSQYIEDVEVYNLLFEYPHRHGFQYSRGTCTGRLTSLVRIWSTDGEYGWGTVYSHPGLVERIIREHLRPHLLGRDPSQINDIWESMYELTRWYGRKGAALSALGGIDIALWDLHGKHLGIPVRELLAPGAAANRVPAYASAFLWSTPEQLAEDAQKALADGFIRAKMRLGRSPDTNPELDIRAFVAIAEVMGRACIMVDGSHRFSLRSMGKLLPVLQEYDAYWLEEPFSPEDLSSYAALRNMTSLRVAAGENEFGVLGFQQLIDMRAIDIAQPDVSRTGGITEVKRIAVLAEQAGLHVATHTWSDGLAVIANANVIAAIPNGLTVEIDRTGNALVDDLLLQPLEVVDGELVLSDRPGLGVDIKEESLHRFRLPPGSQIPEGNYSDLIFAGEHRRDGERAATEA